MARDIIETIGKMLKQAEKAGTAEEAEAFTQKAQALATQHAVDMAVARQRIAKSEKREQPIQKSIRWGGDLGTKNTKAHLVNLFSAVANSNDVRLNIYHNSSGVIAFGFPSDIEVTETLFASLAVQMVEAADKYVRSGVHKGETVYRSKRVRDEWYGGWQEVWGWYPVDGRTARSNFYEGFIGRISTRLRAAKIKAEEAAVQASDEAEGITEETSDTTPGAALVLVQKREEVSEFYSKTSQARGSWKGASSSTSHGGSRDAGSTAGSNARLSSQKGIGTRKAIA